MSRMRNGKPAVSSGKWNQHRQGREKGQRGQEVETCKLEGPVSNPFLPISGAGCSYVWGDCLRGCAEVRPLRKLNTSKWRVLLHSLDPSTSLLRPLQKRWSRKCKIRLGPLTNSRSRCPAMWNRRTVKTCQDGSTIRLLQIRLSLSLCCFTSLLCHVWMLSNYL